jgi:hypothetical protein
MRHAAITLCLFFLFFFVLTVPEVRADAVVLTGGNVRVDDDPFSQFGGAFVAVGTSGLFSLQYSGVTSATVVGPTSASFNMFESGNSVCYLGVCTSQLSGHISFNETTLLGSVLGFSGNAQEGITFLFTVEFTATGVGTFHVAPFGQFSTGLFLVSAPVPEPATLVLLTTGLAGMAVKARKGGKRRHSRRRNIDAA